MQVCHDSFPIEVLQNHVLSLLSVRDVRNLDEATFVNKKWSSFRSVISSNCLIPKLTISDHSLCIISWLVFRGIKVGRLSLDFQQVQQIGGIERTKLLVPFLSSLAENIVRVVCYKVDFYHKLLSDARICSKLRSIYIDKVLKEETVEMIASRCRNLQHLALTNYYTVEQVTAFCASFPHWNRLSSITLSEDYLEDSELLPLLAEYLPRCSTLKTFTSKLDVLTEAQLLPFLAVWPLLEDIAVTTSAGARQPLTDAAVYALVENCRRLRRVVLTGAKVSDGAVVALCRRCPQLTELDVSAAALTHDTLSAILRHAVNLVELSVHVSLFEPPPSSSAQTAPLIPPASLLNSAVQAHPRLQALNVCGTPASSGSGSSSPASSSSSTPSVATATGAATAARIAVVAQHARRITAVSIDAGLVRALCVALGTGAPQHSCTHRTHLQLTHCTLVTEDTLLPLLQRSPRLVSLALAAVTKLADAFLSCLGTHCTSLESLDLHRNRQFTDDGALALLRGCRRLSSLRFADCGVRLTDATLDAIVHHTPGIQSLGIAGCTAMTEASILRTATQCRALTSVSGAPSQCMAKLQKIFSERAVAKDTLVVPFCAAK